MRGYGRTVMTHYDGAASSKGCSGRHLQGHATRCIRNVVDIGIGGSDLGPVMGYEALRHYADRGLTVQLS
jgi:glucose-6-phosphate isomerase